MISSDTLNETEPTQYAPPVLSEFLTQFRRATDHIDACVKPIVKENRNRRKNIVDIESLRASGYLDADETYIPLRIIDENVSKELIPYIKYLITSPRAALFKNVDDDQSVYAGLEADFTRVFRYENWILPLFRTIDCATLNGYGCIEINYDSTKPGRFSFYYISKENLIFPPVASLESSPFVGICLKLSCIDLKRLGRAARFNSSLVARAVEDKKDIPEHLFDVYKVYHKLEGGVIWISYHIKGYEVDWLLPPERFNNGVYESVAATTTVMDPITGIPMIVPSEQWVPVDETRYPIFPYIYKLTDDEMISESEGRGQLDASKQEAESTLVTTYVNASLRASTSYLCVDKQDPATVDIALMDFKLTRNSICNQPLRAITHQFPPQDLMRVANMIDVRSKAEIGQTVWAADNRVDSRKTAEEMRLAAQSKQELDSVAVLLFSLWCGDTLNYCWRIVKSAAMRGEILVGATDGVVDKELLQKNFLLLPAGDVDVIEKQEQLSKRFQAWPIVSTNPVLAQEFLIDILKEMFPRDYKRYAEALERSKQMQAQQSLTPMLLEMLDGLLQMPQNAAMAQQYGQQIQQLKQQTMEATT